MTSAAQQRIAQMDWDTLAKQLHGDSRSRGAASADQALRDYFGEDELAELRQLAAHSRSEPGAAKAGNVILVPGLLGSSLSTVDKRGDEDLIWIHLVRLALGQIERLKLGPDGVREADKRFTVQATDIYKRVYARAMLFLGRRWNVEPFPYDWRKDIDVSARALARFVRAKFPSQPVHLVAHSLGGLVSRAFIRLHSDLWEKMHDAEGTRGGRLIMLGTPNFGSFTVVQALTGDDTFVRLLAAADLDHDLAGLRSVLASFVSAYQLLPMPAKIPAAAQALYRPETWTGVSLSERHLNRALKLHGELDGGGIDPSRMAYIAGCGRATPASVTLVPGGGFEYTTTHDGDGQVTHALGLLDGVPAYFVDEGHIDLPRNLQVLTAVDQLLELGTTSALSSRPIPARGVTAEGARWRRPPDDERLRVEIRTVAERAKDAQASPDEIRVAEEQLLRAGLGGPGAAPRREIREAAPSLDGERRKIQVELIEGDITQVAAPVVVVGHYKGVAPVRGVGAVDAALGYWISQAESRGMIGANLGEVFFIPAQGTDVAAQSVVLAGMGEAGRFGREDLRFLMTNVAYGVAALGLDRFATLLIGSGPGNLPRDRALRGLLLGVGDALIRLPKAQPLKRLLLVEYDPDVCREIESLLADLAQTQSIANLTLVLSPTRRLRRRRRRPRATERPAEIDSNPLEGQRVTIERDGDTFRFSALSEHAVVPVREMECQAFFARGAAERLMTAPTVAEQEKYGRLLTTYLLPEDFQGLIEDGPLTLILDRSTASFPWEMACLRTSAGSRYFGPDLRLTRQFRTLLSRALGVAPLINDTLRVLVIADPAPEPHLQLPGARQEGREVVRVLNSFRKQLDLHVVERIGAADCDPVDILALILDEEFDIIHYAGHGVFNDKNPARSGWVFGAETILSAHEIFRVRRVPRLVFANACFSAVIKAGPALTAEELNRSLAGIAEAFFERGAHNYLGAGWPVADDLATRFAATFYTECLSGKELGESIAAARRTILHNGTTWGAYQHYGQVNGRLVRADGRREAGGGRRRT